MHITDQHVTVVECPTIRMVEIACACGVIVMSRTGAANTCTGCGPRGDNDRNTIGPRSATATDVSR